MEYTIRPIGNVQVKGELYTINLDKEYLPGLKHIEGFSHLWIIWWAHLTDQPEARNRFTAKSLFKKAPPETGVFASRTPERPNPVMFSAVKLLSVDSEKGVLRTRFIDAEDGTPVLDIKPYFPMERIRDCFTPHYYGHWPIWAEDAEKFNWKDEISFMEF
jgi:tRNA (adenine37-N6)-methyltransferase